jgi:hypothetical protein
LARRILDDGDGRSVLGEGDVQTLGDLAQGMLCINLVEVGAMDGSSTA